MKFKIGDRVMIVPGTRYYTGGKGSNNPKDIQGIVDKIYDKHQYGVLWDNKKHNSYNETDLALVNSELFPIY